MKRFYLFIFTLFFSNFLHAQAERIIYENFKPMDDEIKFDLAGEIEIKYWNKNQIRVLTVISTENCDLETLNALVDSGRYELKFSSKKGKTTVALPKVNDRNEYIGDNPIIENFKFEIRLPQGIVYKQEEHP
jgi:hypothetical protein